MIHCCVTSCVNNSLKSANNTFYTIPSILEAAHLSRKSKELAEKRRRVWLQKINRSDLTRFHKVCSKHFLKGKPADLMDVRNPDWAPSLNLGTKEPLKASGESLKERKRRTKTEDSTVQAAQRKIAKVTIPKANSAAQTNLSSEDIVKLEKLEQEHRKIKSELDVLRLKHLASEIHEKSFEDKDDKVQFYTGFPSYALLMSTFRFISSTMTFSHRNTLGQFQEFLLFLMRLRLNLPFVDLAYRFKVSLTTAYRVFEKWLEVCSCKLAFLVRWPDRRHLVETTPSNFRDVFTEGQLVIITDCFEVIIDRTGSLVNRAIMWSQNQNHNTVKFLIGVTPQGNISFVSDAWGGRTPDKHIVEFSGLLDNLLPNDLVLSESGFQDCEDCAVLACAKLGQPACTSEGTSRLSEVEIRDKRKMENLRIHVEKLTGVVKNKFQILQGCLTIDYLKGNEAESPIPLDRIVFVCCALTNLCRSTQP